MKKNKENLRELWDIIEHIPYIYMYKMGIVQEEEKRQGHKHYLKKKITAYNFSNNITLTTEWNKAT